MQGGAFECGAHSGQGGWFRQVGAAKIAVFAMVVNALDALTDHDGHLVKCHLDRAWGADAHTEAATAGPGR